MLRRSMSWVASAAILIGTTPTPLRAQPVLPPQENPVPAQGQGYSAEQVESILAPVALYPDVLLTQILMASAFPLQIVEAYRWVQQGNNRAIRGDRLAAVLQGRNWDPSVKSLVPFPGVLAQMNGNLDWLQQLGFAAANQQEDVLDAVQRLRQRAYAAGTLRSSEQYLVRHEERIIYIELPPTGVVYVPYYNPTVVYGVWAYPAYPPVYFEPYPVWGISPVIGSVLVFGVGIAVIGGLWGVGYPRWHQRSIYIDNRVYNQININRPAWRGQEQWRPQYAPSFSRGGGQNYMTPYGQGGPGRVGPGAGQGQGWAPGQQFRDRGGPGTVGSSGIIPPGRQGGQREFQGRRGGDPSLGAYQGGGMPSGGDGGQFRRQDGGGGPGGGGGDQFRQPRAAPGSDGGQFRRQDGGGGPGGGGGDQFRQPRAAPGGDGGQSRRQDGGGGPGGGGGGQIRQPQAAPGGDGGQSRRQDGGGGGGGQGVRPQQGGDGGGANRGDDRERRRGQNNN